MHILKKFSFQLLVLQLHLENRRKEDVREGRRLLHVPYRLGFIGCVALNRIAPGTGAFQSGGISLSRGTATVQHGTHIIGHASGSTRRRLPRAETS